MSGDKELYKIEVKKPIEDVTKNDFTYIPSDDQYFINYNGKWSMGPHGISFDSLDFQELTDDDIRRIIQHHVNKAIQDFRGGMLNDCYNFKNYFKQSQTTMNVHIKKIVL